MFIIILMVAPMFNIESIRRLMPRIKHPFIFTFLQLVKMLRSKSNTPTDRKRRTRKKMKKNYASKETSVVIEWIVFFSIFFFSFVDRMFAEAYISYSQPLRYAVHSPNPQTYRLDRIHSLHEAIKEYKQFSNKQFHSIKLFPNSIKKTKEKWWRRNEKWSEHCFTIILKAHNRKTPK